MSSLPHARSLCHRCDACRAIVSGRGSVFLLCTARPEKYLPQPVVRCPVFSAAPLAIARGSGAEAVIRWAGAPLAGPVALVADGAGGLRGTLPEPRQATAPADALVVMPGGLRLRRSPGPGPLLGWVLGGAESLARLPAGAGITLTPVTPPS